MHGISPHTEVDFVYFSRQNSPDLDFRPSREQLQVPYQNLRVRHFREVAGLDPGNRSQHPVYSDKALLKMC